MATEQVDEELMAGLERRLAIVEAKMPQSAESDALEGHVHRPIMPRVATVSDLPATHQKPTLYAVALTPNAAPRVFVVYAGGQVELDATGATVAVHTHAIDDDLTGFPIDATQHGTQSTGDLHPEYVREVTHGDTSPADHHDPVTVGAALGIDNQQVFHDIEVGIGDLHPGYQLKGAAHGGGGYGKMYGEIIIASGVFPDGFIAEE